MRRMDWHRLLSSLLVSAYLVAAYVEAGASLALALALPLGLLVALVWHAEALAGLTGQFGLTPIRRGSPPGAVRWLACAFLLVPLAAWVAGAVL